jgi:hypothetical protein
VFLSIFLPFVVILEYSSDISSVSSSFCFFPRLALNFTLYAFKPASYLRGICADLRGSARDLRAICALSARLCAALR